LEAPERRRAMILLRRIPLSRARSWIVLALAALALSVAGVGAAVISSVSVNPPDPTEDDLITISAAGWLSDACWSLTDFDCGVPIDGQISFDMYALDVWVPGVYCAQVIIPYACACDYAGLPAGRYMVTVTEHHDSLRDPLPDALVIEFDVRPVTAVKEITWGRIRALYR
jgi:hypothetical protein